MNVLLSAYACEDKKGSEPETGLKWAMEILKLNNELTVLTRKNNKSSIEDFLKFHGIKSQKLKFIYFECPNFLVELKTKKILPIYLYEEIAASDVTFKNFLIKLVSIFIKQVHYLIQ